MEAGIVMRVHRVRAEVVVAACDAELLGRDLPVGTAGRTVKVSSQFYGERQVTPEEFVVAARRATIVNLLGPRVLAVAEREGMIAPGGSGSLGGVPHAEIFTIEE
ncbi:MAG TPA: DUF424 family protein [Thermoplasmata archaeon]|nr:DUF424 family protein [Thermoplasmata archaeon]